MSLSTAKSVTVVIGKIFQRMVKQLLQRLIVIHPARAMPPLFAVPVTDSPPIDGLDRHPWKYGNIQLDLQLVNINS